MNNFSVGAYFSELQVAAMRARWLTWPVALLWFVFPFALTTLLHPGDLINAQFVLHGLPKQAHLSPQQMAVGFVETVFGVAVILLVQAVCITLFYRRAQIYAGRVASPILWPVAAILPGVIGNALFFVCTGYFDLTGFIIGMSPTAITFITERFLERIGADFVLGPRVAGLH